ncbi:MAG: hypothetical protein PHS44_05770 [Candidatus Dojkabacteria bacterium]|nr:hypothetical protein [Candidatus Dojkabacteria bacterium]
MEDNKDIEQILKSVRLPDAEVPTHRANLRRALLSRETRSSSSVFNFLHFSAMKKLVLVGTPILTVLLVALYLFVTITKPMQMTADQLLVKAMESYERDEQAGKYYYQKIEYTYSPVYSGFTRTYELVKKLGSPYVIYLEREKSDTYDIDDISWIEKTTEAGEVFYCNNCEGDDGMLMLDTGIDSSIDVTYRYYDLHYTDTQLVQVNDKYFMVHGAEFVDPIDENSVQNENDYLNVIESAGYTEVDLSEYVDLFKDDYKYYLAFYLEDYESSLEAMKNIVASDPYGTSNTYPIDETEWVVRLGTEFFLDTEGDEYTFDCLHISVDEGYYEANPEELEAAKQCLLDNGFKKISIEDAVRIYMSPSSELGLRSIERNPDTTDLKALIERLESYEDKEYLGKTVIDGRELEGLEVRTSHTDQARFVTKIYFDAETYRIYMIQGERYINGMRIDPYDYTVKVLESKVMDNEPILDDVDGKVFI